MKKSVALSVLTVIVPTDASIACGIADGVAGGECGRACVGEGKSKRGEKPLEIETPGSLARDSAGLERVTGISTTLVFSHTTVKFVAEAADWRAVASTLAQAQLLVSLVTGGQGHVPPTQSLPGVRP